MWGGEAMRLALFWGESGLQWACVTLFFPVTC